MDDIVAKTVLPPFLSIPGKGVTHFVELPVIYEFLKAERSTMKSWKLILTLVVPITLALAGATLAVETIIDVDTVNVDRSVGDTIWFDSANSILSDGVGAIGLETINGSPIPTGFMDGWAHTTWSFMKYDDVAKAVSEIPFVEKVTTVDFATATDDYYDNFVLTTIAADQSIGLVETTRDFIINDGATLDIVQGGLIFHNASHWMKSTVGSGFLTSSSGELAIIANGGSTDYRVQNVVIKDSDATTPLTLIKTGGDHLEFNAANTYTGGTLIHNGRLLGTDASAFGTGDVTVDGDNAQAFLYAGGTYNNNFIIGGDGWAEGAGQLGALRIYDSTVAGSVTFTGDARIGADALATISGPIIGGEFGLEKAWSGTLVVESIGNTMGKTSVLQGILRIADQTSLGATPGSPVADQITLSGGGRIMGGTSTAGVDLALDANRGITLAGNGGFHAWTGFNINVGGDVTGTGNLLTSDGGSVIFAGDIDIDGRFVVNSGGVTVNGDLLVTGDLEFGSNTIANINSTNVVAPSGLRLRQTNLLTLNVGTAALGDLEMGNGGGNSANVIQVAGDITVANDARIGHWASETPSTYTMQGGTLTLTGTVTSNTNEGQSVLFLGIDGTGVFNLEGGTVTVPAITLDNRGDTAGIDTLSVTGGTLNVGAWGINARNSSYLIELGGGTIGATADWASNGDVTLTGINGDTIFDPGTHTITINGPLTGPGGLIKNGPGSLVLTAVNTYTGTTQVNDGTLLVNTDSSLPYTVAGGALGGIGTISNTITVQDGGGINPGELAAVGTLTIDALDLQSGSESTYRVGITGDLLAVTAFNGLNVGVGATDTHTINIGWAAAPAIGTYPLIDYDGIIGGAGFDGFQLGAIPHMTASLVDNLAATSVDLDVAGFDAVVWAGNIDSTWDVATTENWKLASDASQVAYFQVDQVKFDDTAATGMVNLSGVITPSTVEFNNSSLDYTLTGTGIGGGVTALTKDGTGTLTLLNDNTYGGATTVNNGTLVVGDGTTGNLQNTSSIAIGTTAALELNLPSGATLSASIENPTTVTLTGDNDFTLSGLFTGGGDIVMNGTGTVTMTAWPNEITNIEINSGSIRAYSGWWDRGFFSNAVSPSITINDGGKLETTTHSIGGLGGGFVRPRLAINEGGVWQLNAEHYWSANDLDMKGGLVNIAAVNLRLQGGTLEVSDPGSDAFSEIAGNQVTLYGNVTFQVADGSAAQDFILSAAVNESGGARNVTKTGPGVMVASGANTYAGTTEVNEGTLLVNGTHTGSGQYTVATGGSLGGIGTITAPAEGSLVVVQSGGILAPGSGGIGTLNIVGAELEMTTDSIYQWEIGPFSETDTLNITGGTLDLDDFVLKILDADGIVENFTHQLPVFTYDDITIRELQLGSVKFDTDALDGSRWDWSGGLALTDDGAGSIYLTGLVGGAVAFMEWDGGTGIWSSASWNVGQAPEPDATMIINHDDAVLGPNVVTVDADYDAASAISIGQTYPAAVRIDTGVSLAVTNHVGVGVHGTLIVDGNLTAGALRLDGDEEANSEVTIPAAGQVTIAENVNVGSSATLIVDGTLTTKSLSVADTANVSAMPGKLTVSNSLTLGDGVPIIAAAGTPFTVSGTDLATSADIALAGGTVTIGESNAIKDAIAHWTFDESPGSATVADSAGTYNGDIMGTGAATFVEGQVGGAMHFDGSVYVDLPDGFNDFTGGMTVAGWFNVEQFQWARFVEMAVEDGSRQIYIGDSSNAVLFSVSDGLPPGDYASIDSYLTSIPLDEWVHLAVTREADGTAVVYQNGTSVAQGSVWTPENILRTANFIGKGFSDGNHYKGAMDDLYIFDRVLSATELDVLRGEGPDGDAVDLPGANFSAVTSSSLQLNTSSAVVLGNLSAEADATLTILGGASEIQAAGLGGSGTIEYAGMITVLGTVSPGDTAPGGDTPGTLTVTGNVTMAAGSTFEVDFVGDAADRLHVVGTLKVDSEDDPQPKLVLKPNGGVGKLFKAGTYVLADAEVLNIEFATVEGLGDYLPEGNLVYTDGARDTLTATIVHDLHPGDADLNLTTDVRDFNVWNTNKFTSGTDWASGDFDGNGVTDVRDFNVWNTAKFTSVTTPGAPAAGSQVPEPGTLVLLAIGAMALFAGLRRREVAA